MNTKAVIEVFGPFELSPNVQLARRSPIFDRVHTVVRHRIVQCLHRIRYPETVFFSRFIVTFSRVPQDHFLLNKNKKFTIVFPKCRRHSVLRSIKPTEIGNTRETVEASIFYNTSESVFLETRN